MKVINIHKEYSTSHIKGLSVKVSFPEIKKFEHITGHWLAQVYRCNSTCGFLEASSEKIDIWNSLAGNCLWACSIMEEIFKIFFSSLIEI